MRKDMPPDSASLWESIRATEAERQRILATLREGERLLWLGRPRPALLRPTLLLVASFVLCRLFGAAEPLFVAVVCIIALIYLVPELCSRLLKVYAVTNRRAIVLSRGIFGFKVKSWDVHDYLRIERGKNGKGSIVYEDGSYRAIGLIDLPNVNAAAALVKAPPSESSTAPIPPDFIPEDCISVDEKPMPTKQTVLPGFLLACVAAGSIWVTVHTLRDAIGTSFYYLPATGTVTTVEVNSSIRGTSYTPRYSYMVDGRRYESESYGASRFRTLKPGDTLDLSYPPDRPQDAVLHDPATYWMLSVFGSIFAVVSSAGAIVIGWGIFREIKKSAIHAKGLSRPAE